jgi:hypothetical protein
VCFRVGIYRGFAEEHITTGIVAGILIYPFTVGRNSVYMKQFVFYMRRVCKQREKEGY